MLSYGNPVINAISVLLGSWKYCFKPLRCFLEQEVCGYSLDLITTLIMIEILCRAWLSFFCIKKFFVLFLA
jgi:hypothetical protein